jgi:hypothetical protein
MVGEGDTALDQPDAARVRGSRAAVSAVESAEVPISRGCVVLAWRETTPGPHQGSMIGERRATRTNFSARPLVAMSEPKSLHGLQQVLSKRMNRSRTGKS